MAPRDFNRAERVAGEMRRELARLIQFEVKDPAVGFVSLSDVEVSRDLSHARVYITVFDEAQAKDSLKALNRAAGFLRRRLGQEMRLRVVPELSFRHDASVETGRRMDRLIDEAVASNAGHEDIPEHGDLPDGSAAPEDDEPTS